MTMADRPKGKPGPKPNPEKARTVVTAMRSGRPWKEWLAEFSESEGTDASDLIDQALLMLARERGFRMPPKR